MKLTGKTVVITGGSGGIGSELVQRLNKKGAKPVILDRVKNDALTAQFIQGDLSTTEGIAAAGQALAALNPDVLINLAGIQYFGLFEQQPHDHIARSYTINLLAPVMLSQAVLGGMKNKKDGHIVNIGSIFGSIAFAHFVTYSSAKGGIKAFSEALRREIDGSGVRVTYIAPRAVKTALNNEKVLKLAEKTNMKMDTPQKVADKIIRSIENDCKDVYIGFPESLFVRVNALLPRMVDGALAKNDRIAAKIAMGIE